MQLRDDLLVHFDGLLNVDEVERPEGVDVASEHLSNLREILHKQGSRGAHMVLPFIFQYYLCLCIIRIHYTHLPVEVV